MECVVAVVVYGGAGLGYWGLGLGMLNTACDEAGAVMARLVRRVGVMGEVSRQGSVWRESVLLCPLAGPQPQ